MKYVHRTIQDTIQAYKDQYASEGRNPTGNVFWKHNTLYSYGYHFPMAHRLDNGKYLINADKYSVTTSQHQSEVLGCINGISLSFNTLTNLGLSYDNIKIIDSHLGTETSVRKTSEGKYINQLGKEFEDTKQGIYIEIKSYRDNPQEYNPAEGITIISEGYWHVLGATLIEDRKGNKYICGLDENNYFISQLKDNDINTVDDAFNNLQPRQVREAIQNNEHVVRQGEFFFVDTEIKTTGKLLKSITSLHTAKDINSRLTLRSLPQKDGRSDNTHQCKYIVVDDSPFFKGVVYNMDIDKSHMNTDSLSIYAKGMVYHRNMHTNQSAGQHRAINLNTWHRVYINTSVRDTSMNGRFD